MAQIRPNKPRHKAVRYAVPVAVAGVAAATVGLVPALASTGAPDLPKITAEQLVAKMAESDVQHMSGTVKVDADLGLPSLPGGSGGPGGFGGPQGGGHDGGGDGGSGKQADGSGAAPGAKLTELASGEHTLRVAMDGPDKHKLSVVEDASEYSIVHNARDVWAYDSGSNSAWHARSPRSGAAHGGSAAESVTPQKAAQQALDAVGKSASVTVDGTAKIADRDAYQLVIKPKNAPDSTIGAVRIAVDADNGTPLKFTLTPHDGGKPVVDIAYQDVDFGKPAAKTFEFSPPKGTKVTEADPEKLGERGKTGEHGEHGKPGAGGPLGRPGDGALLEGEGPQKALEGLSGLNIVGKGGDWNKVAEFDTGMKGALSGLTGSGAGAGKDPGKDSGKGGAGPDAGKLLDSLTDEVKGDFGTGRVVSTRLVNALMTEDGKVYVGAVTKEGLIKAAESAAE